jgi:branched-chain amino acid transport system ATP-binding protein
MAGLGRVESAMLIDILADLRRSIPMLLVEHDMDAIFQLADTVSVLVDGQIVAEGAPEDVRNDPAARAAYLGRRRTMSALLSVTGLHAGYGNAEVLFGIDLDLPQGQVTTLMGRNGMGKSTTVRCLMGLLKPSRGTILVKGEDLTGAPPYRIAQAGLGLVPEGRLVFPSLTVSENLQATARPAPDGWTEDKVFEAFPRLAERRRNLGFQLSGGEQQMLAIGRALMTNPDLLILDEATEGLAPLIREEIWSMLARLKASGLSILLIDKNLDELSRISDRYYVIEKGEIVWNGDAAAFTANRAHVEQYLHL